MFLEFYGLQAQPFGVTPDPRFICPSKTHSKAFLSLSRGLEAGCGFLALIGKPGMGKTTLVLQLLNEFRRAAQTVFLFHTQCNSREFLRYLLGNLGLDAAGLDLVRMYEKLNQFLARERLAGRRVVLIIDECHNLDNSVLETVRLLSDFETPDAKLMQIVLVGQTQLADKLSSPNLAQLRQRISILCRLDPLAREDIVRYIEHRLQVAGRVGVPLFTAMAIEKIVKHSEGIPRNINNLCFNALLAGYAAGRKQINSAIVDQVLTDLEMSLEARGTRETDPGRGDRTKVASEFETPPASSVPQIPQAPAAPLPQRPRASGVEADREDFSGSKPDSRNGHRAVSRIGADTPARNLIGTQPLGRPQGAETAPATLPGDFREHRQFASTGVDLSYPADSSGTLKRRFWGISTIAAALLLAGVLLFHFRVGASRRSQAAASEAGAPSSTALPALPAVNVPAAASTSSGNQLIADAAAGQSFLTRNTGPRTERSTMDRGQEDHETGTAGSQEGDADSEFALGVRYALGNGIARDDKQAFALFKKAADQGNISAQSALATAYWLGRGVRKNNVAAYSWATLAHERGDPPSGELLKVLAGMMSPAELNEATSKAEEWQRKHSTE